MTSQRPISTRSTVIIVGAGLAGLAAARRLTLEGITDFRILEAQDRVGGRVSSLKASDGWVELGAQWAHVPVGEMSDLIADSRLVSSIASSEGAGAYLRPGGRPVDQTLVDEVRDVTDAILSDCETFYRQRERQCTTVSAFLSSQFDDYLSRSDNEAETKQALFDWVVRFQVIDNSCRSLSDLSARLWGQFGDEDFVQDHVSLNGGFSTLISLLSARLPAGRLVLSSPVRTVKWRTGQVVCASGVEYSAAHVLVTCSMGFLQQHSAMFEPPLPQRYQQAIQSVGFATINKIFLFYEEPWWADLGGIQLVWSPQQRSEFLTEATSWLEGLTGFDPVPTTSDHVLVGWVGGRAAEDYERLTDDQVAQQCTSVLSYFTGLANLSLPRSVVRSRWNSNEYIRGAYSHLTPASAACQVPPHVTLSTPLVSGDNNRLRKALMFAGEALHERYYSTASGAFDHGDQQARKLIVHLKANRTHLHSQI